MNPNPYAPPQAAARVQRAPFSRHTLCCCGALLAGTACAVLVGLASHSVLYGAATVCASLTLHLLKESVVAWITETITLTKEGA